MSFLIKMRFSSMHIIHGGFQNRRCWHSSIVIITCGEADQLQNMHMILLYIYTCIHTCMHTYIFDIKYILYYIYIYILYIYIYILYIYIYIHIYILYICIYIYIYTHPKQSPLNMSFSFYGHVSDTSLNPGPRSSPGTRFGAVVNKGIDMPIGDSVASDLFLHH